MHALSQPNMLQELILPGKHVTWFMQEWTLMRECVGATAA